VADENWVPSAAGGLQAIGGLGCFLRRWPRRRAGRCILVMRAVRRGRPPMDRSWPSI